jgi:hypothetical protein
MRIASSLLVAAGLVFVFRGVDAEPRGWQPPAGHTQVPIWPGAPPNARPITGLETFATNTNRSCSWQAVGSR